MRMLRSRQTLALLALVLGIVGPAGCDGGTTGGAAPAPKPAESSPPEVTVTDVSFETLDGALKGFKDKVVVVDFWATWCGPCVKKFPHLVEMHKKYAGKGLVCVSVSMDKWAHTEDYQKENGKEKVVKFLKDKAATFPNFIAADPDKELPKYEGRFGEFAGIPHMALFDKGGRKVWDSESGKTRPTDEQLEKMIETELAK